MRRLASVALLLIIGPMVLAEIPAEQRKDDLRQLASLFAKNYGPYEWKKDLLGYDLFNLQPWIDKALAAKTDMEYLDVLKEYTAALDDGHVSLQFPFLFEARLGFFTDIYEGRLLIDTIDRFQLPAAVYPFAVGDELVSVDGISAQEWLDRLSRYTIAANRRSTRRLAAELITIRPQSMIPWAGEIGDTAQVVIRRASGDLETYDIPWDKYGEPVTEIGPVPSPKGSTARAAQNAAEEPVVDDLLPEHMRPLAPWLQARVPSRPVQGVRGFGSRLPYYTLPAGFQIRLGGSSAHAFTSGVFESGGYRIGFLRIPTFSPSVGTSAALQQLDQEIAFFNQNTDGLVVDVTRNPGGSIFYTNEIARRLIPYSFQSLGYRVRATAQFLAAYNDVLATAKLIGLPDEVVSGYEANYQEVLRAYQANRGLTKPISLTSWTLQLEPVRSANGTLLSYSKPLIMLIDELSASAADLLPATLQDNNRGVLTGYRTMGLGGSVVSFDGTNYTEGLARVTVSLAERAQSVATPEYPAAPYIENIGVRPQVELDYMNKENLLQSGRPFVNWFTEVMLKHIRGEI